MELVAAVAGLSISPTLASGVSVSAIWTWLPRGPLKILTLLCLRVRLRIILLLLIRLSIGSRKSLCASLRCVVSSRRGSKLRLWCRVKILCGGLIGILLRCLVGIEIFLRRVFFIIFLLC